MLQQQLFDKWGVRLAQDGTPPEAPDSIWLEDVYPGAGEHLVCIDRTTGHVLGTAERDPFDDDAQNERYYKSFMAMFMARGKVLLAMLSCRELHPVPGIEGLYFTKAQSLKKWLDTLAS